MGQRTNGHKCDCLLWEFACQSIGDINVLCGEEVGREFLTQNERKWNFPTLITARVTWIESYANPVTLNVNSAGNGGLNIAEK